MIKRTFGKTGLDVSILGFGAGHIGGSGQSEKEVFFLLDTAYDSGINLFDTARGYGESEERIGKWLRKSKKDVIISTKVGYGVEGAADWTYDCIIKGVDRARNILKKDVIDIVHLHSCDSYTLQNNGVIDALLKMKQEGKILSASYSGENEALDTAIMKNHFDSFQFSFNIFDEQNLERINLINSTSGSGIIAKRPVANAPWRFEHQPYGDYCEEYWTRMKTMNLPFSGEQYLEISIRFSAFTNGISTIILGTSNSDNLAKAVKILEWGPLDAGTYRMIRDAFRWNDKNWIPQV